MSNGADQLSCLTMHVLEAASFHSNRPASLRHGTPGGADFIEQHPTLAGRSYLNDQGY